MINVSMKLTVPKYYLHRFATQVCGIGSDATVPSPRAERDQRRMVRRRIGHEAGGGHEEDLPGREETKVPARAPGHVEPTTRRQLAVSIRPVCLNVVACINVVCFLHRPSQKSPIALNRYDDFLDESPQPPRSRTPEPKLVARALYNFIGQTSR